MKAIVAILKSDKMYFEARNITSDKNRHQIMKGSSQEENIIILNVHSPNNRAFKYVKQKMIDLKGKIDQFSIYLKMSTLFSQ